MWSSLIFFLHIDGAHMITKKNFIMTTVSLLFLMMRSDITRVHRLTSEPSEHSIGNLRAIKREFTTGDFIHMINKSNRLWISLSRSNLRHVRQQENVGGYAATMAVHTATQEVLSGGPISIETNLEVISALQETTDWTVVGCLWPEVRKVINKTNELIKNFLTKNFAVAEFHQLMQKFAPSKMPTDLMSVMNKCLEATSDAQLFKKEKQRNLRTEFEAQRAVDQRDPRTQQEINNSIRDRMVRGIVAAERGEEDKEQSDDENMVDNSNDEEKNDSDKDNEEELTNHVGQNFVKVLLMEVDNDHLLNVKKVHEAMKGMRMKNREKGSIEQTEKFNTLRGRWFSGRMTSISVSDGGLTIERGSVIKIDDQRTAPYFVVYAVFKDIGSKWFHTVPGDYPSWQISLSEKKRFRLGLREVNLSPEKDKIIFKEGLVDGNNVRKTYKIVKLEQVRTVEFRVNY